MTLGYKKYEVDMSLALGSFSLMHITDRDLEDDDDEASSGVDSLFLLFILCLLLIKYMKSIWKVFFFFNSVLSIHVLF